MAVKLQNRPLRPEEAQAARAADARAALQLEFDLCRAADARDAAKAVLRQWYVHGYRNANVLAPSLQRNSNLQKVAAIPGWQEQKGQRNGYVMLTTSVIGKLMPMILLLDYECHHTGGLTYRQLHQQTRKTLKLEDKVSLRMCPCKPWYGRMVNSCPFLERFALPATDVQCRHLLGTTLLYFHYVHHSDRDVCNSSSEKEQLLQQF